MKEYPLPELAEYAGVRVRKQYYDLDAYAVREVIERDDYLLRERLPFGTPSPVIVDVGAHIGSFSVWARHLLLSHDPECNPRMACVEVAPENIPVLWANTGHFAKIYPAACVYGNDAYTLMNSIVEGGIATGGSRLCPVEDAENFLRCVKITGHEDKQMFRTDYKPVPTVTLEQICADLGADTIDLLKLDCEGAEINILDACDLSRIKKIVGEFHDDQWNIIMAKHFDGWWYAHAPFPNSPYGLFCLINPLYTEEAK